MTEIAFAFEIGGKSIDPASLKDTAQAAIVEDIVESIVERIGNLTCEEHGERPRFLCHGDSFDELSLEVMGCCDSLIAHVMTKLNAPIEEMGDPAP